MPKKIEQEKINKMIELYNQGISSEKIAKELGSKAQTITKYLKENGIEIRGPATKLSQQDRLDIGKFYKSGLSVPKIAEKYDVSTTIISRYIEEQGIQMRSAEEAHRIYAINEDFFDVIDTEEKAYFLGFLYADGCNHKDGNFVTLALEITDKEILEKLVSLIYKDNPLSHIKIYDRSHEEKGITSSLSICSKHICNQLEKLGCMQAKTFKIEYPKWMPENLHQHFIRGYFDGDGSLFVRKKKGTSSSIKITSTLNFTTKVKEILDKELDTHMCIYKSKHSNVYDVCTNGNRQVLKITNWLYKDSIIYMKRKYDLYLKLLEDIENTNKLIIAGTQGYSKRYLKY